ncbi:MAG: hypothetical protein CME36_09620 [unclassified Hahellaceae]|nr:hypothetical protein [Hahellaceae bacterium]|tara:strand:+ start:27070 stop:27291 length:222 start_codon:yes stop_codon:yes gene_type:complete
MANGEMQASKPKHHSQTIIAAVVVILASLAGIGGYIVEPDEQESIIQLVTAIVTAAGGLAAYFGRIKATKKVK